MKWTGPKIEVMRPGPNGPYRVLAHADEAEAKGWEPITVITEPTEGLPEGVEEDDAHAEPGFWSRILGG